jgi:hypothetical protein
MRRNEEETYHNDHDNGYRHAEYEDDETADPWKQSQDKMVGFRWDYWRLYTSIYLSCRAGRVSREGFVLSFARV